MGYSGCQNGTRCRITPMAVRNLPEIQFDGPAVGMKAAAVPSTGCIYVETEVWKEQTIDARAWTYFHEVGHLEGAQCEPCADHRAGEWLRQIGWGSGEGESEDGALASVYATLQHRSPDQAARALLAGMEGHGLDAKRAAMFIDGARNTAQADLYDIATGKATAGTIEEVRPGAWFSSATAADWDAFLKELETQSIPYTVNSSYRSMAEQIMIWDERHTIPWDDADDPHDADAPRNEKWDSDGAVAVPGHSEHQAGTAADISFSSDDARTHAAYIAERHNIFRDAAGERWHFGWGGKRKYPLSDVDPLAELNKAEDELSGAGAGSETNPDASPGSGLNLGLVAVLIVVAFAFLK